MMIARELGMDDERVEVLRFAGILHDVGKLGVPTRLLRKDGPLTPEERRVIELHPEYGHEMVRGIGFLGEARAAILHHHERLDGSGYPYGLVGAQIPEFARVVAVADAFDAMTSTRSYSRARPVPVAAGGAGAVRGDAVRPADGAGAGAGARPGGTAGVTADRSPLGRVRAGPARPPTPGPDARVRRTRRHPRRERPAAAAGARATRRAGRPRSAEARASGGAVAPGRRPRRRGARAAPSRSPARSAATLWNGLDERGIALAFGVLIAVGELARWGARRRVPGSRGGSPRRSGPPERSRTRCSARAPGSPPHHGVPAGRRRRRRGRPRRVRAARRPRPAGPPLDHLARRVLTVGFAAVCFQPLYNSGRLVERLGQGPSYALLLLALLVLTALCDAVLAAALAHARTGWPVRPAAARRAAGPARHRLRGLRHRRRDGARRSPSPGCGRCPCSALPLLLTQLSFRRYAAVRTTYRQTIASLARATEIAGYTPAGHARRVAALSTRRRAGAGALRARADRAGVRGADARHRAALASSTRSRTGPPPCCPAAEQRRIALLGGAVVRQTGVAAAGRRGRGAAGRPVPGAAARRPDRPGRQRIRRDGRGKRGRGGPLTRTGAAAAGHRRDYQPEVVESAGQGPGAGRSDPAPAG